MAETGSSLNNAPEAAAAPTAPGGARSKDEVALELMKFISVSAGYGKGGTQTGAGFSSKPGIRSAEEQAEALLDLFDRCRKAVNREV